MASSSQKAAPPSTTPSRNDAPGSDVYPVARPSLDPVARPSLDPAEGAGDALGFDAVEESGTVERPSREAARAVLRDGVRRAIFGDAPVLAAIQVMAREHGHERGMLPPPSEVDFDGLVATYVERLREQSRTRTFLALSRGEPAGFATAGPSRSGIGWEGEIYALHVHPRFWRARVARNLVAACLDFLHQRGFSALRLWVSASNQELTEGLWSQGFSILEERDHPRLGHLERAFVRRLP